MTLLGGIVADRDTRLSELPFLTEAEAREQAQWNDTGSTTTPPSACTRSSRRRPDATRPPSRCRTRTAR